MTARALLLLAPLWSAAAAAEAPAAPAAPAPEAAPAPAAAPPAPPARGLISKVLDNGLRVSVWSDPDMPLVATQTWVEVGSAHEAPQELGFAHLFEHLMFGETKTWPGEAYSRFHTRLGGSENAYTSFDNTVYISLIAPEGHSGVLEFEADRLQHLVLDPENLRNEQRIVTEELRLRTENEPASRLLGPALQAIFGAHPYGHSPVGTRAAIANADLTLVQKFYAGYYAPQNLHLVIVGPVDGPAKIAEVERLFGGIQKQALTPPVVPPLSTWDFPERVELREDLPPVKIAARVFWGPDLSSPDWPAWQLLSEMLAGGEAPPLRRLLVEEQKDALEAITVPGNLKAGSLLAFASVHLPWIGERKAFSRLDAAIETLGAPTVLSQERLDTARRRLLQERLRAGTFAEERAQKLGEAQSWRGDVRLGIDDGAAALDAVTLAQVQALWARTQAQEQAMAAWVRRGPAAEIAEGPVAAAAEGPSKPKRPVTTLPAAAPPAPFRPAPAEAWRVDDATDVVFIEDHRAPLVELVIQLPVGDQSPWAQAEHLDAAWTLQHHDPDGALRARADALGASLQLEVSALRSTLTLRCLRSDLDASVALLHDIFANTEIEKGALRRLSQERTIDMAARKKDPGFRQAAAIDALFFAPGDPRRVDTDTPPAPSRDSARLLAARDAALRLPGRTIGLAGDLSRAEAEALAARLLPAAGAAPATLAPAPLPLLARSGDMDVEMGNLTQVYLAMAREGLPTGHPDSAALAVSSFILGGHFYSRLNVALRHEGGQTYGASARGAQAPLPETFQLTTYTRAEGAAPTEERVRAALATFHAKGATQEELSDAIAAFVGGGRLGAQSPGQRLDAALSARAKGLPLNHRELLAAEVERLNLDQLNAFITRFYDPAAFTMVRVVPR
ncbi:MAG: hypothetical protein RL071_3830 [Pseudomonadota bacterium]